MRHQSDVLLRQYLDATGTEAERLLEVLLEEVAHPIIQRVVASAISRDSAGHNDAEDVVADTLSDLLRRLRDLREGASAPIDDFRGYIAMCAYNRCHERLRERYPARNRLRNQLHYLAGHHARLALWRASNGTMVCGLREWEGQDAASSAVAETVRIAARSDPSAENRAQLIELVPAVLREVNAPLELDTLVAVIARLIDLEPLRTEVPLTSLELTAELPVEETLALRGSVRELWDDVRRLAPQQRAALLLNLRDACGDDCLSLLPMTRTATMAEIAAAVELPLETLASIWNELPLADARIAELLGITARQVIKLRRLARERLRRMEKSHGRENLRPELDSSMGDLVLARGRTRR